MRFRNIMFVRFHTIIFLAFDCQKRAVCAFVNKTGKQKCCGVSVTPAPLIKLLTYLLTCLSVVGGLGWVHCVGVVGWVGMGL